MNWGNEPKNVISDFLRTHLSDVRSSRGEANKTETFSGTGSSQIITLTPSTGKKARCIVSVTASSVLKSKWIDYVIDMQNGTITGTFASGTNNVSVVYKEASNGWIFPALPEITLSTTKYPCMSLLLVSSQGDQTGNYLSEIAQSEHFQLDIWVKEKYYYDDGTNVWSQDALAMYFARQVVKTFEDNINDLYPKLFNFGLLNIRDAVWEKDREVYHVIVEFTLDGVSIGG